MKTTDYLAIYAAILSTVVFLWNVIQSRPRIRVDLIFGAETIGGNASAGIYVFVRNLSSHEVHLTNIDILYPYTEVGIKERVAHLWRFRRWPRRVGWVQSSLSNYAVESGCPVRLESRKSHKVFIPESIVEKVLSQAIRGSLIASVQDALWNDVYSREFKWSVSKKM